VVLSGLVSTLLLAVYSRRQANKNSRGSLENNDPTALPERVFTDANDRRVANKAKLAICIFNVNERIDIDRPRRPITRKSVNNS